LRSEQTEQDRLEAYSSLLRELKKLRQELINAENESSLVLQRITTYHQGSAANLIHYLALRRHDMRPLQIRLAAVGLSSMGRAESHVLSNLDAVITLLCYALRTSVLKILPDFIAGSVSGAAMLVENTNRLLGKPPENRWARIMVTLPTEAASNYGLVKEMLLGGMDCVRINCAHDDPSIWLSMIDNTRRACSETERECRILMDLAGPKLRTGQIKLRPEVIKLKPMRDDFGNLVKPARIWLYSESHAALCPASATVCLPIKGNWLQQLSTDEIAFKFKDARGETRLLALKEWMVEGVWAECDKTAYIKPGTRLYLFSLSTNELLPGILPGAVGRLPRSPEIIRLKCGDHLILMRKPLPGHAAQYDLRGRMLRPAAISCSLPEIFDCVRQGERVLFDDGLIGGIVQSISSDEILIEINQAKDSGEKLQADKGINLPDTQFDINGLTNRDIEHLEFIMHHADMVGLSFVRGASDIELLQNHLELLDAPGLGIVVKIETRQAFEHLPEILFAMLRWPVIGVMIARGDLAVECGYERLAELQEEILWLAEAAHIPVVWATQVLENMAKVGKPTRAEITDAAMSERAECVMLNKGEHIIQAIKILDNILRHMQEHQHKKSPLLRRLRW
jgi:pyruvate kinase